MKLKLLEYTKNTITNHLYDKFLFIQAEKGSDFLKIMVRNTTLEVTSKTFVNTTLHSFASVW